MITLKGVDTLIKKIIAISSLLLFMIVASACSKDENSKKDENLLKVYTTIFPLQDFTEKIGGEYVDVASAIPIGADAHSFEPTTKDIVQIAESDMFIYNGVGMEGYISKMVNTLKNEKVTILDASKGISTINGEKYILEDDHTHAEEVESDSHNHASSEDPHIWFDPLRAKEQAKIIAAALSKAMPEKEEYFQTNLKKLEEEFDALDKEYIDALQNVEEKEILVSHAAYSYWGDRYGIYQIAVTGLSPSNEPSQKQLAKLIDIVKDHKIKYIFFESFGTPKIADTIQKEVGAKVLTLNHVASVTKQDVKDNKDYFDLMRENLEQLKKGLNE